MGIQVALPLKWPLGAPDTAILRTRKLWSDANAMDFPLVPHQTAAVSTEFLRGRAEITYIRGTELRYMRPIREKELAYIAKNAAGIDDENGKRTKEEYEDPKNENYGDLLSFTRLPGTTQ
jgi:hypothetical protein